MSSSVDCLQIESLISEKVSDLVVDISQGKFIFLSSTRLSPPVTPFSDCAKFESEEERRERGANE